MRYQDLKVGMKVKIVQEVADDFVDSDGVWWDNVWVSGMSNEIGNIRTITSFDRLGIHTSGMFYSFPWAGVEEVVEQSNEGAAE